MEQFKEYLKPNYASFADILNIYSKLGLKKLYDHFDIENLDIKCFDKFIVPLVKIYFIYIKDYIEIVGFSKYYNKINNYSFENQNQIREFDALLSGMMFFFFSFLYVVIFPDWEKTMSGVVKYNVLYLLIDHYLDDDQVLEREKKESIKKLYSAIVLDKEETFESSQLTESVKIYKELILEYPQTEHLVKELLILEINSVKIQKEENLLLQEYYDIAILKGGYTMLVISSLIKDNESNYQEAFLIGAIMQLIDDSLDINEDNDNSINTYATKIKKQGEIDEIFYDIFGKIKMIKNHDIIFLIFIVLSCYIPNKYPENYSKDIFNMAKCFNILPVNFPSYLLNYLEENKITLNY